MGSFSPWFGGSGGGVRGGILNCCVDAWHGCFARMSPHIRCGDKRSRTWCVSFHLTRWLPVAGQGSLSVTFCPLEKLWVPPPSRQWQSILNLSYLNRPPSSLFNFCAQGCHFTITSKSQHVNLPSFTCPGILRDPSSPTSCQLYPPPILIMALFFPLVFFHPRQLKFVF